jgi:two-component system sensor histidine kinase MtrB
MTLPCRHGHELTSSPLPLVPPDLPPVVKAEPGAPEPVEEVELTEEEITWQPAQPVTGEREEVR